MKCISAEAAARHSNRRHVYTNFHIGCVMIVPCKIVLCKKAKRLENASHNPDTPAHTPNRGDP